MQSTEKVGSVFKLKLSRHYLGEGEEVKADYSVSEVPGNLLIPSSCNLPETRYNKKLSTVLYVEDNPDIILYVLSELKSKYNIYYALNGKLALEILKEIPQPDLVISDIMMDEMDGYQLLDHFMKSNRLNHIPFIFLTAKSTVDEKILALKRGAVDYISKPFMIDELDAKISALLSGLRKYGNRIKIINGFKVNEENFVKYNITKREQEVIRLIHKGKANLDISQALSISEYTVKNHIKNIFQKTNARSRMDLMNILK